MVQKNSKVRIKVVHSGIEEKGYQVIVLETISKGTFVAEYTGEILPPKEAKQRLSSNNFKNNYLLCIGEIFNDCKLLKKLTFTVHTFSHDDHLYRREVLR